MTRTFHGPTRMCSCGLPFVDNPDTDALGPVVSAEEALAWIDSVIPVPYDQDTDQEADLTPPYGIVRPVLPRLGWRRWVKAYALTGAVVGTAWTVIVAAVFGALWLTTGWTP